MQITLVSIMFAVLMMAVSTASNDNKIIVAIARVRMTMEMIIPGIRMLGVHIGIHKVIIVKVRTTVKVIMIRTMAMKIAMVIITVTVISTIAVATITVRIRRRP